MTRLGWAVLGLATAALPLFTANTYYLYVGVPSLKVRYGDLTFRSLLAQAGTAPGGAAVKTAAMTQGSGR